MKRAEKKALSVVDGGRAEPATNEVSFRVPPHDAELEAVVLSAILVGPDALGRVTNILRREHFYAHRHGTIFDAAIAVAESGEPVDAITVAAWLRREGLLAGVGGAGYIAQIANETPAVHNVEAHAVLVRDLWRLRATIATCQRIAAEGFGRVRDVQAFVDQAEQQIYELARSERRSSTTDHIGTLVKQAFDTASAAQQLGDDGGGLKLGYREYDELTGGHADGDLVLFGGRPGMGKTSLVVNAGVNVATGGDGVFVSSLEMTRAQLGMRVLAAEAMVDLKDLRRGRLPHLDDWRRATGVAQFAQALPMWVDDAPTTVFELRAKVRRQQALFDRPEVRDAEGKVLTPARRLRLVIVDYIQMLEGDGFVANRDQELSAISRGLKRLGKELGVVVIALSSLNRKVEERQDKRPQMADLRESGSLESDADTIVFVYRDEYYHPKTTSDPGIAELIIGKNRSGPLDTVRMRFDAKFTRFGNLVGGV